MNAMNLIGSTAAKLLSTARGLGLAWLTPLVLARHLGLRVGEIMHIRVSDFDFSRHELKVWTSRAVEDGQPFKCYCVAYRNGNARRDVIELPSPLAILLRKWIQFRSLKKKDWMFPSSVPKCCDQRHLTRARIAQIFDEVLSKSKLINTSGRRWGFESLRILYMNETIERIKNPELIAKLLRHHRLWSSKAAARKARG